MWEVYRGWEVYMEWEVFSGWEVYKGDGKIGCKLDLQGVETPVRY